MRQLQRALLTLSGALLAACAAGGNMYAEPYALFEPHRAMQTQDMRPAFVTAIDGVDRGINDNDPVSPGLRRVEVSVPGAFAMSDSVRVTFTVDAKPCTRYMLGAKQLSTASRDWSPVVAAVEPIGECLRKFPSVKQ
jgi:hypothetical protein